jgi:iron complex outermembrane receptor protein
LALEVSLSLLAILCASALLAQTSTGRFNGTVTDAGGTPLAGVTITVLNQETGASASVRTSAGGKYEVSELQPGLYTISTDVQGYRKIVMRSQRIDAGATVKIDFGLELKVSEEIKVTAMRREESIFKTPVSVTAPTEDVMRERGVQDIEDVATNVPNFEVQNLGPGQSTVAIRGISAGQIARDQPGVKEEVGFYLDESTISLSLFTPDIDLFDMNRVEVLRGPQGTLFGSGSLGGTVRYISNQPLLGVTQVFGEVTGNAIDNGGTGGSAKAGFNMPLGSLAALRVAAYYNRLAGWIDAVQPDLTFKRNVNAGDREGVRLALDIAPTDNLTITPRFVFQKVAMEGWNRVDEYNILANPFTTTRPAVTLGDNKLFNQIDEPTTDKFYMGDLDIKYNFGPVVLTSITSFTNRDILVVRDAGALTASITGGSIGLPEKVYTLDSPLNDKTHTSGWTEELRLSGGTDKDRFQWVGGFFYADNTRHYDQKLIVKPFQDLTGINTVGVYAPKDNLFWSDLNYDLKQYNIFGEGTFAFTNRFRFTAGLRYYHYNEDKAQIFDGLFGADSKGHPQSQPGTVKADGVAPRFIASYNVTDDFILNAQAAKGFRLGGVNDPLNVTLCTPQDLTTFSGRENWKDETDWSYEINGKTRFMNGRGTFAGSAFYADVKDLQVTVTAGSCSSRLIFNVPKSRSVGGEFEVTLAPTDHFDFAASAGYNDSTVRSTIPGSEDLVVATGIRDGNRLPSTPKFQAGLAATYQTPVAEGFQGYATGSYQHIGSRYTQLADQEAGVGVINLLHFEQTGGKTIGGPLTQSTFTFDPLLPSYDLLNFRMGVRHLNWDTAFAVNNITDKQALLAIDRERGFFARQGFLVNQPRTFVLTTRVDF